MILAWLILGWFW